MLTKKKRYTTLNSFFQDIDWANEQGNYVSIVRSDLDLEVLSQATTTTTSYATSNVLFMLRSMQQIKIIHQKVVYNLKSNYIR